MRSKTRIFLGKSVFHFLLYKFCSFVENLGNLGNLGNEKKIQYLDTLIFFLESSRKSELNIFSFQKR